MVGKGLSTIAPISAPAASELDEGIATLMRLAPLPLSPGRAGQCSIVLLIGRVARVASQSQLNNELPELILIFGLTCVVGVVGCGFGLLVGELITLPNSRVSKGVSCRIPRSVGRPSVRRAGRVGKGSHHPGDRVCMMACRRQSIFPIRSIWSIGYMLLAIVAMSILRREDDVLRRHDTVA